MAETSLAAAAAAAAAVAQALPAQEEAQTKVPAQPERPKAKDMRLRTRLESNESAEDYTEYFNQLQIRPDRHQHFFTGALYPVRQKHLDELKRGTDASMRNLSALFLRGYGYKIWPVDSAWLVDEPGEERLGAGW